MLFASESDHTEGESSHAPVHCPEETPVVTQDVESYDADTKVRTIEVANPSKEEMAGIAEEIKVNYNFNVAVKPVSFNFKKSKDKDTGIETVRKPVGAWF